jgi:hypothetical protein
MLTLQAQILDLAQEKLVPRSADLPGFADYLLTVAEQVGEVRGTLADENTIRFEIRGQSPLEIRLPNAKSRLRTMCARLGHLCMESGQDITLYGGEGIIDRATVARLTSAAADHGPVSWYLRFQNTMHAQEFTITAVEDTSPCQ